MTVAETPVRVRVWDAPTRLFHWALVLLIGALWWTGEQRMLDWHRLAGYGILTLLLFRLAWGFVGSTTSRFSNFVRAPHKVASYVGGSLFRRGSGPHIGHNPLGGWSVIIMLLLLAIQVGMGLVAVDVDGIESGPFSYLVDFETGRWAAEIHHLLFNVLLAVIALHVVAAIFYLVYHRHDLIGPMVVGARRWSGDVPALTYAPMLRGLIIFAASALLVWGIITLFGRA